MFSEIVRKLLHIELTKTIIVDRIDSETVYPENGRWTFDRSGIYIESL